MDFKTCCTVLPMAAMVSFITSCSDDDSVPFPNRANLEGRVQVQNQFQQPLYEERDSIDLTLESGFLFFEVDADIIGKWQLLSAPVGSYLITAMKPGYSTVFIKDIDISSLQPNYAVVGGFQQVPTITITKLPTTQFDNLNLELSSTISGTDTLYELALSTLIIPAPPPTGQAKGYRIFVSKDPDLSPQNYLFQQHYTTLDQAISLNFDNAWFDSLGFDSGDEIYASLYGDANFNQELLTPDSVLVFPNISEEAGASTSVSLP